MKLKFEGCFVYYNCENENKGKSKKEIILFPNT